MRKACQNIDTYIIHQNLQINIYSGDELKTEDLVHICIMEVRDKCTH